MHNEPTVRTPKREPNIGGNPKRDRKNLAARPTSKVSWGDVANQLLRDTVVAVTDAGAAILLGRTSDGGALSLQVLDGDERIKEYPHSSDDAEAYLRWILAMYSTD